jgi:ABC-2 type transport system ATP-binding protein
MSAISVRKLGKTFGAARALSDVSFDVATGSITGFLGPNGAGKSTTMNILLGFIAASSGSAKIFGQPVSVSTVKTRCQLGFLSSNMALDRSLTVAEELKHYGYLAGRYDAEYTHQLARQLDLDQTAKIGKLSTGNYQKVGLIIALMNRPKLLILDEPTNGLDPLVQAEFNKIILGLKETGSTVFISSHILSEVETLCDDFIFIRRGQIVTQLTRQEIDRRSQQIISVKTEPKNQGALISFLTKHQIDYTVQPADLENLFMRLYDQPNGDDNA